MDHWSLLQEPRQNPVQVAEHCRLSTSLGTPDWLMTDIPVPSPPTNLGRVTHPAVLPQILPRKTSSLKLMRDFKSFFCFWLHWGACGILVEAWSPNHWMAKWIPLLSLLNTSPHSPSLVPQWTFLCSKLWCFRLASLCVRDMNLGSTTMIPGWHIDKWYTDRG